MSRLTDKTYELLLDAFSCALRGESVRWYRPIPRKELVGLISLAREHSILPMLAEAAYDTIPFLEEPLLRRQLLNQARSLTVIQAQRTADFLLFYEELKKRGLAPVVTKGIMCRRLYPHPDQRLSVDEDLLVSEKEFPRLHSALMELGFKLVDPENFSPEEYEVSYTDDARNLYIEVHKRFFEPDSAAYGDCNEPFVGAVERAKDVHVGRTLIRTLESTDHLLYLICHAYKHFLYSGVGIRQVADMCMFAGRYADELDKEHIVSSCERLHIGSFAAALFRIGREYLGFDIDLGFGEGPDPVPLLSDMLSGGLYGANDINRLHASTLTLDAVASHRRGKRSSGALHSIFLPRSELVGRYPYLKKRPWLLPAAWVQRVWRYLFKRENGPVNPTESLKIGRDRVALFREYGIID